MSCAQPDGQRPQRGLCGICYSYGFGAEVLDARLMQTAKAVWLLTDGALGPPLTLWAARQKCHRPVHTGQVAAAAGVLSFNFVSLHLI